MDGSRYTVDGLGVLLIPFGIYVYNAQFGLAIQRSSDLNSIPHSVIRIPNCRLYCKLCAKL